MHDSKKKKEEKRREKKFHPFPCSDSQCRKSREKNKDLKSREKADIKALWARHGNITSLSR
jgi:hypothetical protein